MKHMQVFDYHISPKLKKGLVFKSFYFQGETKEEKTLGDLFIVAELSDSLSCDTKILNDLSNSIKKEFFQSSENSKQALTEALKKGNHFLEDLSNKGNVRWLGNLNFTAVLLKDFSIYFSKTGNIHILLLRGLDYHDIAENLESQQPSNNKPFYPFSNVASGQLSEGDKIIILTQDIFDFFHAYLAEKIMKHSILTPKTLAKMFKEKKEEMEQISGIFFLIFINQIRHRRLHFPKIKFPLIKIKKEVRLIIVLILILLLSYLIFK